MKEWPPKWLFGIPAFCFVTLSKCPYTLTSNFNGRNKHSVCTLRNIASLERACCGNSINCSLQVTRSLTNFSDYSSMLDQMRLLTLFYFSDPLKKNPENDHHAIWWVIFDFKKIRFFSRTPVSTLYFVFDKLQDN